MKRTNTVAYTEALEQISANTSQISTNTTHMADDLGYVRLRQQLEHLDERWSQQEGQLGDQWAATERELAEVSKRAGSLRGGLMLLVAGVVFPVIMIGANRDSGAIACFIGLGLIVGAIVLLLFYALNHRLHEQLRQANAEQAEEYNTAEEEYTRRRARLLSKIDKQT